MKPLNRILSFARPHQKYLFGSIFFNILYSVLNIFSVATMMPILGMMFGTTSKVDTSKAPVFSGRFGDSFKYIKEYAYYNIQLKIDEDGVVRVLAILCIVTAFSFLLRNVFRYLGSFLLVN